MNSFIVLREKAYFVISRVEYFNIFRIEINFVILVRSLHNINSRKFVSFF